MARQDPADIAVPVLTDIARANGSRHAGAAAAGIPAFQVAHALSIHADVRAGLLTPGRSDSARLLGRGLRPVVPVRAVVARQ